MRLPEQAEWRIDVDGKETTAVFDPATSKLPRGVFVFAHGAGGHLADRGLLQLSALFCAAGLHVVRFNFLYRQAGSPRPDPMPRLMACFSAVVARVRLEVEPDRLIMGGRSMGGRTASMLAAEGFSSDGLLLLAYPLHPPDRPEQLRDAHLPAITIPVLCFNGTRDKLCRRDLMEKAVATVQTGWEMHWLEGADHSFRVLKSSGRTDAEVLAEISSVTQTWLGRLH